MKKAVFILFLVLIAVAVVLFFPSAQRSEHAHEHGGSATHGSKARRAVAPIGSHAAPFLHSDVMIELRAAFAVGDRESIEHGFAALVEHIKAHPEEIDAYLAALRSEDNEHVLRALARAIAVSGAIWGDPLAQTAIELAKDTSFEQRQHIMLHLMSSFPELREDLRQTALDISHSDPESQVKTSAVVLLADWIESFPEKSELLMNDIVGVFRTAADDDVRGFTYQLLALHRDNLAPEIHAELYERLKSETDTFSGNLIVLALSAAPEEIRARALAQLQSSFESEPDLESRRNLLAQIVCLSQKNATSLLEKAARADSLLAEDAREYLAMLSKGERSPEVVFMDKARRDAIRHAALHPPEKH